MHAYTGCIDFACEYMLSIFLNCKIAIINWEKRRCSLMVEIFFLGT
jgi:hypothetical protein